MDVFAYEIDKSQKGQNRSSGACETDATLGVAQKLRKSLHDFLLSGEIALLILLRAMADR
jgi:hypothetical protein